jgi:hypothetical protein
MVKTLEGRTDMLHNNVDNKLPTYVAPHSGKAMALTYPRRKFENQRNIELRSEILAAVSSNIVFWDVDWQTHMNVSKKAAHTFQKAQCEFRPPGS